MGSSVLTKRIRSLSIGESLYMRIEFKGYYFIVTSKRVVSWLGRFISLGDSAMAITFYPFLFVRPDTRDNSELLRHETIHIKQQLELFIVGAWLLFIVEFCYARYVKRFDSRQSYYYTASEQEAHRNAMKEDYLSKRKPYAIFKYVRDKKWLGRTKDGELIVKEYR